MASSTLTAVCRYREVAYLDTDVGQAEFTPPGFVSLIIVDKVTPGNECIWILLMNFFVQKLYLYTTVFNFDPS